MKKNMELKKIYKSDDKIPIEAVNLTYIQKYRLQPNQIFTCNRYVGPEIVYNSGGYFTILTNKSISSVSSQDLMNEMYLVEAGITSQWYDSKDIRYMKEYINRNIERDKVPEEDKIKLADMYETNLELCYELLKTVIENTK